MAKLKNQSSDDLSQSYQKPSNREVQLLFSNRRSWQVLLMARLKLSQHPARNFPKTCRTSCSSFSARMELRIWLFVTKEIVMSCALAVDS